MFPILFQIGGVPVHSYGVFFAIAYLCCVTVAQHMARKDGLDPRAFLSLCFISIVTGLLGSRLMYVIVQYPQFVEHPEDIFKVWHGGMVFYGGFFLAWAADMVYIRWRKLPLLRSLDILAVAMAVAQSVGRIGCLGAGCCHGSYCDLPWAIHLDTDQVEPALRGLPIHPTQIYESLGTALLALALYLFWKRKQAPGITAAWYCLGYATLRFVIELFRGDSQRGFVWGGAMSSSQLVALVVTVISSAILFFHVLRKRGGRPLGR